MQVKPSYGVTQGFKGATSPVARQVAPRPGVSTPSNLDSTRRAIVKRGCVVEFPGGCTARVARVRLGYFCSDVATASHPCSSVRVVS